MKRVVIASLVGALICWVYTALSWMVLPVHDGMFKHTEHQDSILSVLSGTLTEPGLYLTPLPPPGSSQSEMMEFDSNMEGKSYAVIHFITNYKQAMVARMVTGFVLIFIALYFVAWVITSAPQSFGSFGRRFMVTVAFFAFAMTIRDLIQWNWMDTPGHALTGEFVDMVVMAILVGSWNGKYLK